MVREGDTKKEAMHDSKHMNHVQGRSNHEENYSESHAHHDHSKHHSHEEHHHSEYENHNGHDHSHHHEHMVKDFKKKVLHFLNGYHSNSYFISDDSKLFRGKLATSIQFLYFIPTCYLYLFLWWLAIYYRGN